MADEVVPAVDEIPAAPPVAAPIDLPTFDAEASNPYAATVEQAVSPQRDAVSSPSQRAKESLSGQVQAFLQESGGPALPYEELVGKVRRIADDHILSQAQAEIDNPGSDPLRKLQMLAAVQAQGSTEVSKNALGAQLASVEDRPLLYHDNYDQFIDNRNAVASEASNQWISFLDKLTGYGKDEPVKRWFDTAAKLTGYRRGIPANPLALALKGAGQIFGSAERVRVLVGQEIAAFTPGSGIVKLLNTIHDQFPDAPLSDSLTVSPKDQVIKLREYLYNLPPEKAKLAIAALIQSAQDNQFFDGDTYGTYNTLRPIFDGIEDPNRHVTFANIDVALDAAALGLLLVPYGKIASAFKRSFGKIQPKPQPLQGDFIPRSPTGQPASPVAPALEAPVIEGESRVVPPLPGAAPAIEGASEFVPAVSDIRFTGEGAQLALPNPARPSVLPVARQTPALPGSPILDSTSAASVAAQTPAGSAKLVGSLSTPSGSVQFGATPPSIVGSLVVPPPPLLAPTSQPFLPSVFIDGVDQIASVERAAGALSQRLGTSLINSPYEFIEGGWKIRATIGKDGAIPFATMQEALAIAPAVEASLGGPVTAISNGRGFYLQGEATHYFDFSDTGIADKVTSGFLSRNLGRYVGNQIGKGFQYTTGYQARSTEAAAITEARVSDLKRAAVPILSLSNGERNNLFRVLERIEGQGTDYTYADFIHSGLTAKEARGGEAVRAIAKENYRIRDRDVRGQAVSEGYLETSVGGQGTLAKPSSAGNGAAAVDHTGTQVVVDRNIHSVWELVDEINGTDLLVLPKNNAGNYLSDLRQSGLVYETPNYLTLKYDFSHYVDEIVNGKRITRFGANSAEEAEETARYLRTTSSNKVVARGNIGPENRIVLKEYASNGFLNTGRRRPTILTDLAGATKLDSIEQRLSSMLHSTAVADGIGQWAKVENQYLRNTWGDQWDIFRDTPPAKSEFVTNSELEQQGDLLSAKEATASGLSRDGQYAEALARWEHVRNVSGVSGTLLDQRHFAVFRELLADALQDNFGKAGRAVAGEVTGRTAYVTQYSKSIGNIWLELSPQRQIFSQLQNLPIFLAEQGALPYLTSGRLTIDTAILAAARTPFARVGVGSKIVNNIARLNEEAALAVAERAGVGRAYAKNLIKEYQGSKYFDLARAHGIDLESLSSQAGIVNTNILGSAIKGTRRVFGAAGYDVAVNRETAAAWLISKRSFETTRGRGPKSLEDYSEVNGRASRMQLSLNRGDQVPLQKGLVGAYFQFLAAQSKSIGRVLALEVEDPRAPGLRAALSGVKARRAALQLLSYGASGYGLATAGLYLALENKGGYTIPPDVKYALDQGFAGASLNAAFSYAFDKPGEQGRLDVSGSISPAAQLVQTAKSAGLLMQGILYQEPTGLQFLPPSVGLVATFGKSVEFALALRGQTDLPITDQVREDARDFFTRVPITNSWAKATAAYNLGIKNSASGQAQVAVTGGEAAGSFSGFDSVNDVNFRRAKNDYYPTGGAPTPGDPDGNLKDAAKDTMKWLGPLIRRNTARDGVSSAEAYAKIKENLLAYKAAFSPGESDIYFAELGRLAGDLDEVASGRWATTILQDFSTAQRGHLKYGEDALDYVRSHPFPGDKDLLEQMENMLSITRDLTGPEQAGGRIKKQEKK